MSSTVCSLTVLTSTGSVGPLRGTRVLTDLDRDHTRRRRSTLGLLLVIPQVSHRRVWSRTGVGVRLQWVSPTLVT